MTDDSGGLRVVGAGLGRTGTASLKIALEQLLGGRCHHMVEVFRNREQVPVWTAAALGEMPEWTDFLRNYRSLVDWPGASFWPELSAAFPDALVLLSVRDLDEWYESASATIFHDSGDEPHDDPESREFSRMWLEIRRQRFVEDLRDRDLVIEAARAHNQAVMATIPDDRLLVWSPGDGWGPICDALGIAVPDRPFPRANTREEFIARREADQSP